MAKGAEQKPPVTKFYWDLADHFLREDGVDEGTLMGFPCLRVGGEFFSTCDHRTGDLIVKLPKARVEELVAARTSEPFAPAGRVFKEWTLVRRRNRRLWNDLLAEAKRFVDRG